MGEKAMTTVEPIRDPKKIVAIKSILKNGKHPRDYLLFTLGINLALRVSDLLALKVKDILDRQGNIVEAVHIRERKTGKEKRIKLNGSVREALEFYFSKDGGTDGDEFLFKSLRSDKPLDRIRANTLVNRWCREVGLQGKFGTHSLRKTWGYRARKIGVPIELIQEKLGHRSPAVTRRYIGITQEEVSNIEEKVCL